MVSVLTVGQDEASAGPVKEVGFGWISCLGPDAEKVPSIR
jgi:hypothetical protein